MKMEKRLINIKELALYLGISTQTIRNQLSQGTFLIKPIKLGRLLRWDKKEVDRFIDKLLKQKGN